MKLERRLVPKPWGRTHLPPMFGGAHNERIGEVWFAGPERLPLLAKYLFTSERLSIQDHPNDAQARSRGLVGGKEECWYVLDAQPGATIALGWMEDVRREDIAGAANNGSIVDLLDWRPVSAGDFYYVPAGTVHAIGAGLSLFEFQQNSDVTYRLYDYGRARELHLDDAVAVADTAPYRDPRAGSVAADESRILFEGPFFSLAHSTGASLFEGRRRWVFPIDGLARSGGAEASAGEGLLIEASETVEIAGRALIGAEPA